MDLQRQTEAEREASSHPPTFTLETTALTSDQQIQTSLARFGTVEKITETKTDEEGNPIAAGWTLTTDNIHEACRAALSQGLQIVIAGALTSGTKNFGAPGANHDTENIILIQTKGSTEATELTSYTNALPKTNEAFFTFDESGKPKTVIAGPGVIPDHINEALTKDRWLALDLTTRNQAHNGAVFATGGMGPSRIRPSEIIKTIWLSNGNEIHQITDPTEIKKHEGMIGLTGAIVAIEYQLLEVPTEKFGTLVPLNVTNLDPTNPQWPEKLAELLAALNPSLSLEIKDGKLLSAWQDGFIDGVEIITLAELEMIAKQTPNQPELKATIKALKKANSQFAVYITGRQNPNLDEEDPNNPIHQLCTLNESGKIGEPLDLSNKLPAWSILRELIPTHAKAEAKNPGENKKALSTSTDINARISDTEMERINQLPEAEQIPALQQAFQNLLQPFVNYEAAIAEIQTSAQEKNVEVLIRRYGHGHPRNIDLHTRVTATAETANESNLKEIFQLITEAKKALMKAAFELGQSDQRFTISIGEKGIPPTIELLTPEELTTRQKLVAAAPKAFSWRAKGTPLTA